MRLLAAIGRFLCALRGHDVLPQFEPRRMFLRCVSCGYESPGWDLSDPTPRVRVSAKVRQFQRRMVA